MSGRPSIVFVRAGMLAMALSLSGCGSLDSLNPFRERETPLPGARKPLFPPGHPYAGPQQTRIPDGHAPAETPPQAPPQAPPKS